LPKVRLLVYRQPRLEKTLPHFNHYSSPKQSIQPAKQPSTLYRVDQSSRKLAFADHSDQPPSPIETGRYRTMRPGHNAQVVHRQSHAEKRPISPKVQSCQWFPEQQCRRYMATGSNCCGRESKTPCPGWINRYEVREATLFRVCLSQGSSL